MNPDLDKLQPYPFQRLAALFAEVTPNAAYSAIRLSIGEPKHPTPEFIHRAVSENLAGLASYPLTLGMPQLRETIAQWLQRRYQLPAMDVATQVLPVNGSREALFAFAQTVIDRGQARPVVICPNPFYQIYEGAALLAGAQPVFVNARPENNFKMEVAALPEEVLQRTQLIYVCSPGNPTGRVLTLEEWQALFALSDRYDFVIASDECYSEIYFDTPPLGALQAAQQLGRDDYRNLVIFSSLSKRSNAPGMRSGFVAGDARVLEAFRLYRTYHGSAMNPVMQQASVAAWNDEAHVAENRRQYAAKFERVIEILSPVLPVVKPEAGFYLWVDVSAVRADGQVMSDTDFAKALYRDYNVVVLPGSYLARDTAEGNPGRNFIRMALVAEQQETVEAAQRMVSFISSLN